MQKGLQYFWMRTGKSNLGAREDVGIRIAAGYQLAENNPEAEDVRLVVIVLAPQALGGHPVWGSNLSHATQLIKKDQTNNRQQGLWLSAIMVGRRRLFIKTNPMVIVATGI